MWFRKINNKIVNKSALEKKSNLRIRNKITSVLLLKNFKNWKCTGSNKECYFAKIKAIYPTQINWKKLNKTKRNPIFSFHFLVMFTTTLNIKLIIAKFNFIVVSIFVQYFTICGPHVSKLVSFHRLLQNSHSLGC